MAEDDAPQEEEDDVFVRVGSADAARERALAALKSRTEGRLRSSSSDVPPLLHQEASSSYIIVPPPRISIDPVTPPQGYAIPEPVIVGPPRFIDLSAAPPPPVQDESFSLKRFGQSLKDKILKDDASPSNMSVVPTSPQVFSRPNMPSTPPSAQQTRASLEQEAHDIMRSNYLNMCKMAIKNFIESSIGYAHALGDEHLALKQLLLIIEMVLRDGLKQKRSVIGPSKDLWGLIESLEKSNASVAALCAYVKSSAAKTSLGKARAFIRFAMMQKALSDQINNIIEYPGIHEWYEPYAFALSDACFVVAGMLVSIQSIDTHLDLSEPILDWYPPGVVDMSAFFKDGNYLRNALKSDENEDDRFTEASFAALTDQKVCLEEVNRNLTKNIQDAARELDFLQGRLRECEVALSKKDEQLIALGNITKPDASRIRADEQANRSAFERSKQLLEEYIAALQLQFDDEHQLRNTALLDLDASKQTIQELERKLHAAEQTKSHLKDFTEGLKKQLGDAKSSNQSSASRVQELQALITELQSAVEGLQSEKISLQREGLSLQSTLQESQACKQRLESTLVEVTDRLKAIDGQRLALEESLAAERSGSALLLEQLRLERARTEELSQIVANASGAQLEYDQLLAKHVILQSKFKEQEKTLLELGEEHSKKAELLLELQDKEKPSAKVWEDDSAATECKQCDKPFNVSRRKHHCRNCGGIFCNDCSNVKMTLASSAKPVRVCEACQMLLLAKMTSS